jgi:Flp pilus assembly pilin Flp
MFDMPRLLFAYAMLRRDALRRRQDSELGASAIEWAIISAIVVAAAVGLGLIITTVVKDKGNEIQQQGQ